MPTLRSAAREVEDLHLAAAQTKAALQSVLHNVTDMEQLVQVQILAQNIIEFSNAMTAGLEAVLDNKLSPSLVPENLLRQDFCAFCEHATVQGLTPVIQDHKQGQPLQVYVRVPLKPTENHAMFSLFLHKSLPTVSGDKVVRIHGMKTILAVGPVSCLLYTSPSPRD